MSNESPNVGGEGRIEIPVALAGERVDRAVSMITGRSRAEVAELIAGGEVRINGVVVTVRHQRVVPFDVLTFSASEVAAHNQLRPAEEGAIDFVVVYEDESIIVVDKPAGLVIHPGAGHLDDTLASGLIARYPDLVGAARDGAGDPSRPGIVHRLDRDTSGLLVVARTPASYDSLVAQLAVRSVGREYIALAIGNFDNEEGMVDAPIGRSTRFPTKMTVHAGGREARTRYNVLERFVLPIPTTLVHLQLETGRTHQIRVHLSAIGHPVAGDLKYGGQRSEIALGRPFLHAERLRITHPGTNAPMEWESALPAELQLCLRQLRPLDHPA